MDEIISLIKKLSEIRKIPQFLFVEVINPKTLMKLRGKIQQFKFDNPLSNEIDFIINSPGGSADDAYRIIRTLRKNFSKVNIIVPFWAKSAATLLSLGGSQIIMDEFGEFGPIDVQIPKELDDRPDIESESALIDENSLNRIETRSRELYLKMFTDLYTSDLIHINKNELSKQILDYLAKFYEPLLKQINPYKIGDKNRKLDIGEQYARRILSLYNPDISNENKNILVDYLVNGCPDHGYVIDYDLISRFLSNIKKSTEFGNEYEQTLNQISNNFVLGKENVYIDFVLKESKLANTEIN
ncbi:MAG: ATP-dependent Clp protease proteolytic subunit [Candidatus Paceibacterota bacterium]